MQPHPVRLMASANSHSMFASAGKMIDLPSFPNTSEIKLPRLVYALHQTRTCDRESAVSALDGRGMAAMIDSRRSLDRGRAHNRRRPD